ncbi:hypothetical protein J43TS9_63840 [Paenibacillus cineris]|nr:hypothetical protein J43TS9_63840 [Paenibacillus cineris]
MTKLRSDTGFNRPIGAYCFFIITFPGHRLFGLNPDSQGSGLYSPKAGQFGYSHSIPEVYGKIIKYECEPTEGAHVEIQEIKF